MIAETQFVASAATRSQSAELKRSGYAGYLSRLFAAVCFLSLAVFLPLHCTRHLDPQGDFARTWKLFETGYLERSQEIAATSYQRFRESHPGWASQFLLVEAEAMVWRGMNDDALKLLAVQPLSFYGPEGTVKKLTLEGLALTRLHQFSEAAQRLAASENLCALKTYAACGGVYRAKGVLALEQGALEDAKEAFLKSLAFARAQKVPMFETTVLLNLGVVALQSEHYDEALDWLQSANKLAVQSGEEDLAQTASGNLGWAYFKLGDKERSLQMLTEAEAHAAKLGDLLVEIQWSMTTGYVYMDSGRIELAKQEYRRALESARKINSKEHVTSILSDLAQVALASGNAEEADEYASRALASTDNQNKEDRLDLLAIQSQVKALRGDAVQAQSLLHEVEVAPESQTSMKWASELAIAKLHERLGETSQANHSYLSALATFEAARNRIEQEDSQLPFLTNATRIYDDYIHFLVSQGKVDEALAAADQSRARTLAQGLGVGTGSAANGASFRPAALRTGDIARRTGATVLFYWLGEKQSYLWAIGTRPTKLFTLPARSDIAALVERYRKSLLEPDRSHGAASEDAIALYNMLVAPAAGLVAPQGNVAVVCDGPLSLLNFETLTVPGPRPHYWIEDVDVISAPSLSMLAAAKPPQPGGRKLLLMGDAVSPNADYPDLPMASVEMKAISKHFDAGDQTLFSKRAATSDAYLKSNPRQYSYIHFVAHGVASRTEPLDSAIILSRTTAAEDSFKLHAREIIQHPIDARLVTISACYGGGTRSYAGEGLVGLSWAFLRAGAHNVIGALWEASDDSTPLLMDSMYQGIENGMAPSAALRQAKLALLHSAGRFKQPFYWAPFQIYTGL